MHVHGSLYSVEWNDGMERWNGTVEWNSVMTTPTSRAMTNTRNDLFLSTEDRTVQWAFELVLARQVWDWSPAKSDFQASSLSFSSLAWPRVTWSLELRPYPRGDLTFSFGYSSLTNTWWMSIAMFDYQYVNIASRARPTPQKNRGRPGRSGDVIGRGLGRGCVSPPTRPRANCARWLWIMKQEDKKPTKIGFWLKKSRFVFS